MQRRHLEAAVHLEANPSGCAAGGAMNTSYEAVKEEQILRVAAETRLKENITTAATPAAEHGSSNAHYESSTPVARTVAPPPAPLRETCRAVASEIELKLERWKEQLAHGGSSSSSRYARSPSGEPSLSSLHRSDADDQVKLLNSSGTGGSAGPHQRRAETWPGIFKFTN